MRTQTLRWAAALACMVASSGAMAAELELRAVSGTVRVRPTGPVEGAAAADLACARNEIESFQLVVTARGGPLSRVDVTMDPLRQGDHAIPADAVTLYRVEFVPLRRVGFRATEAPGLVPDPLVPFVNPYTGERLGPPRWNQGEGRMLPGRFGGAPFDVWTDHHQPVWVDIRVPKDTPPGVYDTTIRVTADGAAADMPLRLEVWDFTLPDGPTHENHFGGFARVASYLRLEANSEAFLEIEDRYSAMMADHRINPALPRRLIPAAGEDGTVAFDAVDAELTAFVERYRLTNVEIPRAPFRDPTGEDRAKALNFYRSWYAYVESKGWADGAYLYMLDEPNTPEEYETVRRLGALVAEAEPRLRRLVVEQPYTHDPAWGDLDDAIDIWCPLFGFVHEPSVKRVQAAGDEVWSYSALVQNAPPYHPEYDSVKGDRPPYWQLDFPLISYRIATWLNRRYGITGLLYWSTCYWGSPERNPWDEPGFRGYYHGDGALFYPGVDAGLDGPVGSIRLKALRDGMEDYEYFALLEARGGADAVEAIVREAVPTWGSWNPDPAALSALRRRLAEAIMERGEP